MPLCATCRARKSQSNGLELTEKCFRFVVYELCCFSGSICAVILVPSMVLLGSNICRADLSELCTIGIDLWSTDGFS